jgi:hypothetical protein
MGTWGTGVFENDHALDLFGIEVDRLAEELEKVLKLEPLAFDDLEGPLLYVHLLGKLAKEHELGTVTRERVARWKTTYLRAFDATVRGKPSYIAGRRRVIVRAFTALSARLPRPE